jgi:hypothetical protein
MYLQDLEQSGDDQAQHNELMDLILYTRDSFCARRGARSSMSDGFDLCQ